MHFQSFDSLDDMQAAIRQAEEQANARVTDQQRRLTFGDHWFRPMGSDYDYIFIFGRILGLDEYLASTLYGGADHPQRIGRARRTLIRAEADLGRPITQIIVDPPDDLAPTLDAIRRHADVDDEVWAEAAYTIAMLADTYSRGYRFGKAWSLAEPRGELGDTHISEMCPMTADEFADAKAADWDMRRLIAVDSDHSARWAQNLIIQGATLNTLHRRDIWND